MSARGTTTPGYVNHHGQVVVLNTYLPGSDHGQHIYEMRCSHRAEVYGVNGTNIYECKCPNCQGGRPGLELGSLGPRPRPSCRSAVGPSEPRRGWLAVARQRQRILSTATGWRWVRLQEGCRRALEEWS